MCIRDSVINSLNTDTTDPAAPLSIVAGVPTDIPTKELEAAASLGNLANNANTQLLEFVFADLDEETERSEKYETAQPELEFVEPEREYDDYWSNLG